MRINWIHEFVNGGLLAIGKMADGTVTVKGFHLDKEVFAMSLFKSAEKKMIEAKRQVKDAGRSCFNADDWGPQRFCALCEAKLYDVYDSMDTTPLWAHPESVERFPVLYINKKGKEVPRRRKINGKMEIVYTTHPTCEYSKGDLVKDDDVVSHIGSHKESSVEVETEMLAWADKKLETVLALTAQIRAIERAKTQDVFNITYPALVKQVEEIKTKLSKQEKEVLRWRHGNKDAIDAIYRDYSDDAGALPTDEVEDSTTMTRNRLWTLRKMTYLAKGLRANAHITEHKTVNGTQYSFPSTTVFNAQGVYTMFKNLLTGKDKEKVEFSNDEERSYWNELCEVNLTHRTIQYKTFLKEMVKATRNVATIEELATITCEEAVYSNY